MLVNNVISISICCIYKAINTYQQVSCFPLSVNLKQENPIVYTVNFTQSIYTVYYESWILSLPSFIMNSWCRTSKLLIYCYCYSYITRNSSEQNTHHYGMHMCASSTLVIKFFIDRHSQNGPYPLLMYLCYLCVTSVCCKIWFA